MVCKFGCSGASSVRTCKVKYLHTVSWHWLRNGQENLTNLYFPTIYMYMYCIFSLHNLEFPMLSLVDINERL